MIQRLKGKLRQLRPRRIYYMVSQASCNFGYKTTISDRVETMYRTGPLHFPSEVTRLNDIFKERFGQDPDGQPLIANFKWIGIHWLGREWRWV